MRWRCVAVLSAAGLAGGTGCQSFFGVSETEGGDAAPAAAAASSSGSAVECGDGVCASSEDCMACPGDCVRESCMDAHEPNDESPDATDLALDRRVCDLGICAGDADWFRVDAPPATRVKIEYKPSLGDLDLEIYDPGYVTGSYETTSGEDEVVMTQLTAGEYVARVYGKADDQKIANPCYCIQISSE